MIEQGIVDLLVETGAGERLQREGLVHHGIELQFAGERHRIPLSDLAGGRAIVIYGQTEVVKDLIGLRLDDAAARCTSRSRTSRCTTSRPSVRGSGTGTTDATRSSSAT